MKKKTWRYSLVAFLALLLIYTSVQIINIWPLLTAKSYFEYHFEYQRFKVHWHKPPDYGIGHIFGEVEQRIRQVPIFEGNESFEVLLCNEETYTVFAEVFRRPIQSQGIYIPFFNYVLINVPFIREMQERSDGRFSYNLLEGNIIHIISHEIIHQLLKEELGFLKVRSLPQWKQEGFCEYWASRWAKQRDPSYTLKSRVDQYNSGFYDQAGSVRKDYIEAHLLTEYYFTELEGSIQEFFQDDIQKSELRKQLELK